MSKCSCGKYEKCIREIHSTNEGKLYVKIVEHFKCGIIQKQIQLGVELIKPKQR